MSTATASRAVGAERLHPASRDSLRLWLPTAVGFLGVLALQLTGFEIDGVPLVRDQALSQMVAVVLLGIPFVAVSWAFILRATPAQTRLWARRERGRNRLARLLLGQSSLLLVLISLAAYGLLGGLLLLRAEAGPATRGLAVAGVVTTWAMLQTSYVLYYAYVHCRDGAGLDFPGDDETTLIDYAYSEVTWGLSGL